MYYYNGAQRYEQFLQVGQLYRALILLGLALLSSEHLCVFVFHGAICVLNFFCLHPSLYLLVSWAWWDWPLTWLTNHRPSVLLHCWLGHVIRKIVSEMTYNVSSGTLNTTIPYFYSYMTASFRLKEGVIMLMAFTDKARASAYAISWVHSSSTALSLWSRPAPDLRHAHHLSQAKQSEMKSSSLWITVVKTAKPSKPHVATSNF